MMPSSKVTAGGLTGLLATALISILQSRFGITLSGDEAALLTGVLMTIASYITPHIPPPPPAP